MYTYLRFMLFTASTVQCTVYGLQYRALYTVGTCPGDMGKSKNFKVRINVSENYANCVRTLDQDVNSFLPFPLSSIKARTTSTLWSFVIILFQVNLFYAVGSVSILHYT